MEFGASPRQRRARSGLALESPHEVTIMATTLLPFQPLTMSTAQLAAVSYLARYSGRTHALYSFQLRRWFSWCETNGLDPLSVCNLHVEGLGTLRGSRPPFVTRTLRSHQRPRQRAGGL